MDALLGFVIVGVFIYLSFKILRAIWRFLFARSAPEVSEAQKLADSAVQLLNSTGTSDETFLLLQKFKLDRKEIQQQLKYVNQRMKEVRSEYTDTVRRMAPAMRGGGWFGRLDRAWQSDKRHSKRVALANALEPASVAKSQIENRMRAMDLVILETEKKIIELKRQGR